MTDNTTTVENAVNSEREHKFRYVPPMWLFIFKHTKAVSVCYLVLGILLALSRPALAFIWERYIAGVQMKIADPALSLLPSVLLIAAYFALNALVDIIQQCTERWADIDRLDLVQANRMQELMQTKMFAKLSRVSPEYFEVAKINDSATQVFNFVGDRYNGANVMLMRTGSKVISKFISVVCIALTLYVFNPWLCLLVLVAPLCTIWSSFFTTKLQFKFIKSSTKLYRRAAYFQDLMLKPSAKEIKALGLYDFFYGKWKRAADEYTSNERKTVRTRTFIGLLDTVFSDLLNIAACIFAVVLTTLGQISLGELGAVIALTQSLSYDVLMFTSCLGEFIGKRHEAAQFTDMMELPEEAVRQGGAPSACVECSGLRYRYPLTDKYVLDGVTLTIRRGEKVALVGENGAGKSTFVKLLTNMLAPSGGQLNVSPSGSWSAVMQEPVKYNTFTVGDNVFLGDVSKERDETAVDAALEFSGLGAAGKSDLLGKDIGGTDLSGGQWQELAIARAVYRNRDIVILDEPTGNLDPLAEAEVFKKYTQMSAGRTVIFVTHRISAAALAERVIVFSKGRVAEDGAPSELLALGGEYSR
ncbi:MAG: ABC transporter ATP-binding protein/permease, partial [Oscillospiraceae bacterium]|nr:ABC transporter ATP-binding protein/permease [Oscillospiraceae bacterium]